MQQQTDVTSCRGTFAAAAATACCFFAVEVENISTTEGASLGFRGLRAIEKELERNVSVPCHLRAHNWTISVARYDNTSYYKSMPDRPSRGGRLLSRTWSKVGVHHTQKGL